MPNLSGQDARAIVGLVNDLESRARPRFDRYDADERLWNLEQYVLQEVAALAPWRTTDMPVFTSNDPRNLADLYIGALTLHRLEPRGDLLETTSEREEELVSLHERFARGVWREVDQLRAQRGEHPFQLALAWFHALRGGSIARVWVDRDEREHPFRVALWDPRETVWQMGRYGPSFACRHYQAAHYEISEAYDQDISQYVDSHGNVDVYDAWWQEGASVYNAVICGGQWLKEPTVHAHLVRVPVFITLAFGSPVGPSRNRQSAVVQNLQWDSIYGANRLMYATYNRAASIYELYLRRGAVGPIGYNAPQPIQKLDEALRPFALIWLGPKGRMEAVSLPPMAQEAREYFAALQGHIQRGGVPFTVFGQTPFELSGVAVSQLQGALEIRLKRLARSMIRQADNVISEVISQFVRLRKRVQLVGRDKQNRPFLEAFRAADLSRKYYLTHDLRTDLPLTRLQEANIALMWKQVGVSLLSIYDEVLHRQDPNWEYRRKLAEDADRNPLVAGIRLAETLRARQRPDLAEIVLGTLRAAQAQAQAAGVRLPQPQAASPEMLGIMEQHSEFQTPPQNMSLEERAGLLGLEVARR